MAARLLAGHCPIVGKMHGVPTVSLRELARACPIARQIAIEHPEIFADRDDAALVDTTVAPVMVAAADTSVSSSRCSAPLSSASCARQPSSFGVICPRVTGTGSNTANVQAAQCRITATPLPIPTPTPEALMHPATSSSLRTGEHALKLMCVSRLEETLANMKITGRYRYFAELKRQCGSFPQASFFGQGGAVDLRKTSLVAAAANAAPLRNVTVWCSNDYLGMGQNKQVLQAMHRALDEVGAGAGGTRNISGTCRIHVDLERELADWHHKESALLFQSGFVANETSLISLATLLYDRGHGRVHFFSDELNHRSLIDGMRFSRGEKHVFRHNDVAHLEQLLRDAPPSAPKIVVFESVYSMEGSIAPIGAICDVAAKYGAFTFLDEVHAVGMYGARGAGIAERDHVLHKVDIISGTLGKAVGVGAGYVAASAVIIDAIRSHGAGFIFSTAVSPVLAAGALASIRYLKQSSVERTAQQNAARALKASLHELGLPVFENPSHIVPVMVYDAALCRRAADMLLSDYGIYVQPINYPTVPEGTERLRLTPGPLHTRAQTEHLLDSLCAVWERLQLPLVDGVDRSRVQERLRRSGLLSLSTPTTLVPSSPPPSPPPVLSTTQRVVV